MYKRLLIYISFFMCLAPGFAQNLVVFEGLIVDQVTQEVVADANIVFSAGIGLTSDEEGHFSIKVKRGSIKFTLSHTKYVPQVFYLTIEQDTSLVIELTKEVKEIDEVEVRADRTDFVKNAVPGMHSIKHKDLVSQPAILGVPDVISVLQSGTGVQSVSEGVSGIYVRGGGAGQNLILYDNIELVDPSHLLGTYSAFNPYQVERVDLYKGNSPVQYAGRLSSSIIVSSFDDVSDQPLVTANLGTLASSVSMAYQKGNWGIMMGLRRTQLELYEEVLRVTVPEIDGFLKTNNYRFQDFNGKLVYNNKKHDQVALSWYTGGDDLLYGHSADVSVGINWHNKGAALTWKHTKSSYSLQTVLGYSNYGFDFEGDVMGYVADFTSIYNAAYLKHTVRKSMGGHLLTGHMDAHYYDVTPQRVSLQKESEAYDDSDKFTSVEGSFSLADNWQIDDQFTLYFGLRANEFIQLGEAVYHEVDGADTTTTEYAGGEAVQQYFTLSPQVFLTWAPQTDLSYKLAYSYNAQNVHRGSLATLPLPADLWITSTKLIKPEYAHLASFGVYKSHDIYDFSAEVYGKVMKNILLFEPNMAGEFNLNFEDNFQAGDGYSAGLELLARKNSGKFNGWIAYTLSKSQKRIEGLKDGDWFDAKYDRTHDLSVILNYQLSKKWEFSSSFVLASGNKSTVPAGRYYMMGYVMNDYTDINGFRMPTYHRLDLSVNYHFEPKFFKESVLNLSVINVYNRKNTYFFFYEMRGSIEDRSISVEPYQFSLFPVLPSLSWTFKF